jgi:ankyrin repeat protein
LAERLIEALRSRKIKAVREAIKADPKAARGARPVVEAGRLAFRAALELLHRNGADLNAIWRGYRALHSLLQEDAHKAAEKPDAARLECLDWLLAHGADPEQLGAWPPARAIIVAAFVGEPEYVGRLRKAGAKVDAFVAAALGDRKMVEKALRGRSGFALERDSNGMTALQYACGSRMAGDRVDIARMLIENGAEVRAKVKSWNHDVDAVYFAASAKNKPLFELLLQHGVDATDALTPAIWNGDDELAELSMKHGADPDGAVAESQPLLNNLIRWGQFRQAFWLLARGASPNLPDSRGWTAMHQAASRGNERMMRALIDAGGDLSVRNKEGLMPADVAKTGFIASRSSRR